ncbi:MAG: hypothetical protein H8E34_10140 [Bacteroidetes bacterium]|nr:hypothetical protein [Bacteroidota bacterium]MBL6944506.1 hypothetical protein [Bacteroidales bacterium]
MKSNFFLGLTILGLSAILLTSCSKVPQVEIDAANAAIEEAKTAGAETYVHDNYVALQDSMNAVMVSIETQKSKFFKNYATAKENLTGVTQFAIEVKVLTENRKSELKVEIQNTIAEATSLIDINRQLILKAPKGKEGTSALIAIKGELNTIEATLAEANTMLEAGDLLATLDKANAAKAKATTINTELTEVIAKYNKRR